MKASCIIIIHSIALSKCSLDILITSLKKKRLIKTHKDVK